MMMPEIPVLETARLTLRGPQEADFEPMIAFGASDRSDVIGYNGDRLFNWRLFLAGIGHWAFRGYGMFTVTTTDTDDIVARVGLVNHDGWPEVEIGWHAFEGHEGRGYVTEAAQAVLDWAARAHGFTRLMSIIHPDNTRSEAVARRLGAVIERKTDIVGVTCNIWRHREVAS